MMMKYHSKKDTINWKVTGLTEKGTEKNIGYRKYLLDAIKLDEGGIYLDDIYFESFEAFKSLSWLVVSQNKSGEYEISKGSKKWWHRNKNKLLHTFFEHRLKKICIEKEISFIEALELVLEYKEEID